MHDQLYRGTLKLGSLQELLELLFDLVQGEAFALLEMVPAGYFDEQQREQGLQIVRYRQGLEPAEWTRGRVFNSKGELRWVKKGEDYQAIYAGTSEHAQKYLEAEGQEMEVVSTEEGYYLWGEKLSPADRQEMGLAQEAPLYLELQIPRVFAYPVDGTGSQKRCKMNIVCYYERVSGIPQYFRLHSLQEVN